MFGPIVLAEYICDLFQNGITTIQHGILKGNTIGFYMEFMGIRMLLKSRVIRQNRVFANKKGHLKKHLDGAPKQRHKTKRNASWREHICNLVFQNIISLPHEFGGRVCYTTVIDRLHPNWLTIPPIIHASGQISKCRKAETRFTTWKSNSTSKCVQ